MDAIFDTQLMFRTANVPRICMEIALWIRNNIQNHGIGFTAFTRNSFSLKIEVPKHNEMITDIKQNTNFKDTTRQLQPEDGKKYMEIIIFHEKQRDIGRLGNEVVSMPEGNSRRSKTAATLPLHKR